MVGFSASYRHQLPDLSGCDFEQVGDLVVGISMPFHRCDSGGLPSTLHLHLLGGHSLEFGDPFSKLLDFGVAACSNGIDRLPGGDVFRDSRFDLFLSLTLPYTALP
ncbi:hypothetical protein [Nocardia carnea]|uniref:hypothetical protein n=1 Tax=Nocardia carnea TaxID=37328 RepID=UPI002454A622|nr:hypothetical protein [Nocardia carnea]